jgi:hypothetical protein
METELRLEELKGRIFEDKRRGRKWQGELKDSVFRDSRSW